MNITFLTPVNDLGRKELISSMINEAFLLRGGNERKVCDFWYFDWRDFFKDVPLSLRALRKCALFSEIHLLFFTATFLNFFMETKTGEVRPLKSVKCSDPSLALLHEWHLDKGEEKKRPAVAETPFTVSQSQITARHLTFPLYRHSTALFTSLVH